MVDPTKPAALLNLGVGGPVSGKNAIVIQELWKLSRPILTCIRRTHCMDISGQYVEVPCSYMLPQTITATEIVLQDGAGSRGILIQCARRIKINDCFSLTKSEL